MSTATTLLRPPAPTEVFNSYILANAVFGLHCLGMLDPLHADESVDVERYAADHDIEPTRLRAMADVLVRLGYLTASWPDVRTTDAGRELLRSHGFFTWIVGGYGEVLRKLPALARGEMRLGRDIAREDRYVAEAGEEIDVVARVQDVITDIVRSIETVTVVDLGCGNLDRLLALAETFPHLRGWGVDISPDACAMARDAIVQRTMSDRVAVIEANVLDYLQERPTPDEQEPDLVVSFFMLHDLFARRDPVTLLQEIRQRFPSARHFLLGDTTRHDFAAGVPIFSLGFELLHAFMDVPIRPHAEYESAFAQAGLHLLERRDAGVPSTSLYLLRPA